MAEIEGLKELSDKLVALGKEVGGKTLRQAAMNSTTPVIRELRAAAPVGSRTHKTYRGRYVGPGFLSRSITRASKYHKESGRAVVRIGVRREAFYGVSFVDQGTRKMSMHPWFKNTFIRNRQAIEDRLKSELKRKIEKIAGQKK